MQNITFTVGLKEAIKQLQNKQAVELQLLKEQFNITYESLKPVNLIRTFTEAVASPDIISNILSAGIGLTTGFFSKRIFASATGNLLKKVFGGVLLLGVTKIIVKKPELIKSFGQHIVQRIFSKKVAAS